MKPTRSKPTKQLPSRDAMAELSKSPRSIADYAKATPISATTPNVLQNLAVKR